MRGKILILLSCGLIAPLMCGVDAHAEAGSPLAQPVLVTDQFAFFSDFATNLNDALIFAAEARGAGEPELFDAGPEAACFVELSAAERAAWDRTVDFYADVVAAAGTFKARERNVLRLELAGVVAEGEWEDPWERRFAAIGRAFRAAAAPPYEACRWPAQDRANRRWIDELAPRLARHEEAITSRLAEVYATAWEGVPFRVDVVETADPTGANAINLDPPGAHILISSSKPGYKGDAALEMVFHEAAHFLTGRGEPVPVELTRAMEELRYHFRGDLTHWVNFYMTGEVVRRLLEAAGEPAYEPYLYAQGMDEGGKFRSAVERTWPPYLDGERTLPEAAEDLIRALLDSLE